MKIVLLGPAYPLRGGIAHHTGLLYRHLSRHHEVRVITFSRQYPGFLFPGTSQREEQSSHVEIPSEALVDSLNPLTWVRTARAIEQFDPDVLLMAYWLPFFGLCYGTIARLVRAKTRARVMFLCHNIVPHERRWGDIALTRFAFRFADSFIVQARTVADDLRTFVPSARYELVHHPLYELFGGKAPIGRARKQLKLKEKNVLLFFGYVRPYKGLDILLAAMPRVLRSVPAHLLIVGEFYEPMNRYLAMIRSLKLEDKVTVVSDYVPSSRVGLYFSASDAVVLPYRSATQSGIAQIAYFFDKPVISTSVGGLAEVIEDGRTGYLVPPEDPDQLADAIIRFLTSKKRSSFSEHVRSLKKRYAWDVMVKAVESLGREERRRS